MKPRNSIKARKPKFQRTRIIEIIAREVRRCMKAGGDCQIIDDVLTHGLAWCKNYHEYTYEHAAQAVIALAPLAERDELEHTADSLVSRHKGEGAARAFLEPLGVRYAACGCLAQYASDMCCGKGVEAARERKQANEARKASILEALAERPELFDKWIASGEKLVAERAAKRRAA